MNKLTILTAILALLCVSCRHSNGRQAVQPDRTAMKALQGVWVNEDEEDVAFRIKGDTVFFPDSATMPVPFVVCRDTFILNGANRMAYPIVKRTAHLFVFVNQNGEQVRLVKSDDKSYLGLFDSKPTAIQVNQNQVLKRDTVLSHDGERYHSYVQVNPTTYKVIKAACNDDGVQVDNIYYDNIIHLGVFQGSRKVYSSNMRRADFAGQVPAKFLEQTVFSDLVFAGIDAKGLHYHAVLAIPDTMISYIVEVTVGYDGRVSRHVSK